MAENDESKKAVTEFMRCILLGFAAYIPAICLIFAALGRFKLSVLFAALYGSAVMTVYYLLFASATAKAAADSDPEAAKKRIQASYSLRMFLLVILIGAGVFFSTDYAPAVIFSWLPIVAAMIVPRISIAVWQIISKAKEGRENKPDGN